MITTVHDYSQLYSVHVLQVSNLFARDEMDELLQELMPVMKKEFPRRPPTNDNLYSYYMSRVKHNLHVALCFSPVPRDITSLHCRCRDPVRITVVQ